MLTPLMMFGWLFVALLLFATFSPRRAVIAGMIYAWLYLPVASYPIPFFVDYDKANATTLGLVLGILIFDANRAAKLRFKWVDLFIVVFCFCQLPTSLVNGLGIYDGLTQSLGRIIRFGMPYLIGRIYFSDVRAMRELMAGVVIGTLSYVPLVLFEARMSPQLHRILYGYHTQSFAQTIRMGGYRPVVFMEHGLMLAMWMTMAFLFALTLWHGCRVRRLAGVPMLAIVAVLFMAALLCRSAGALFLLMLGAGILLALRRIPGHVLILPIALVCLAYIVPRAANVYAGQGLYAVAETVFSTDRAQSLQFRLDNEQRLVGKALQRPLLGWGGWGRSRVFDERGNDVSTTDSMWVIVLGSNGWVGLIGVVGFILGPVFLLPRRIAPRLWAHPALVPAAAFALVLTFWMVDSLFNDMPNPVYSAMAGGLAGLDKIVLTRRMVRRQSSETEERDLESRPMGT